MKRVIIVAIIMLIVGYLFADVSIHIINKRSPDRQNAIGRKYYPALYKMKEHIIYPMHNKSRVKSYGKGSNGTDVTQMRSGYKVKK
jgi:hypothetical protein